MKIFISHASEDKSEIARPLAIALKKANYDVWFDEYSLTLGDNLRRSIEKGLNECDFGVVILSENYFKREWPQKELDGLFQKENDNNIKVILPVWHAVTKDQVSEYSNILANRVSVLSSEGLEEIVKKISVAVYPSNKQEKREIKFDNFTNSSKDIFFSRLDGKKLTKIVLNYWLEMTRFDKSIVRDIDIFLYHDSGGVDEDSSGILLHDDNVIPITEQIVLDSINKSSSLSKKYTPVGWVVPDSGYTEIDLTETYVFVLYLRHLPEKITTEAIFSRLVSLASNKLYAPSGCIPEELADEICGENSVTYQLMLMLTQSKEWSVIQNLIFEVLPEKHRWRFLFSSMFVEQLSQVSISSIEPKLKSLMEQLIKKKVLNDYWKARVRSSLLSSMSHLYPTYEDWEPDFPIEVYGVIDKRRKGHQNRMIQFNNFREVKAYLLSNKTTGGPFSLSADPFKDTEMYTRVLYGNKENVWKIVTWEEFDKLVGLNQSHESPNVII